MLYFKRFLLPSAAFLAALLFTLAIARADETANTGQGWSEGWKGSVDAGLTIATGNTESENLSGDLKLNRDGEFWNSILAATARNVKENNQRTDETYTANGRLERNLTEKDSIYAALEYVDDRFGGYDYRVSESVGYGRTIHDMEHLKVQLRGGVGARQSKYTPALGGGSENEAFLEPALSVYWKPLEWLEFTEELSSAIGSETTITTSKSALKSPLGESLFLKLGLDVTHNSQPPLGTESTDSYTSLNLGYQF